MEHDKLYSTAEAAALLRKNPYTLIRWRWQRSGPPFCRLGREVFYRAQSLQAWIEGNEIEPLRPLRP